MTDAKVILRWYGKDGPSAPQRAEWTSAAHCFERARQLAKKFEAEVSVYDNTHETLLAVLYVDGGVDYSPGGKAKLARLAQDSGG